MSKNQESQMMERCLQLARKAEGQTAPNPLVGCVIVKNGVVIGEGYHPGAGQPHAEVFALRQAGVDARDATVYVSLEPCNHYGRTPPCTEALINAQVKKVVVGMIDPDERVSGSGVKRLRDAGIEVVTGVEEKACLELNEGFCHRIKHKRPFGIFKYAMTLDGKIATATGHSQWITSPSARNWVHHLRSKCDAVIVGGNTVRKDNPSLTTHGVTNHNPLRVVMSKSFDLPETCNLWETDVVPTVVFTRNTENSPLKDKLRNQGVEIIEEVNLHCDSVMSKLYDKGLNSVLWECGGNLISQAIEMGNVQKVYGFIAPKLIGGNSPFTPIGNLGIEKMDQALELKDVTVSQIDRDFLLQGYLSTC